MLEVRGVTRRGLGPIDLAVAAGECLVVRGPSGAGKSLLLRAIADLDPAGGAVSLDGMAREALPAPRWRALVRYLAAEPGWWTEAVADHFDDWPGARPYLDALGLPVDIGARAIAHCSTGERQRLALVRALSGRPRVLLLDEPTSALDPAARAAVEALMAQLQAGGMMIVWVTHDDAQGGRVADRVFHLAAGGVAA